MKYHIITTEVDYQSSSKGINVSVLLSIGCNNQLADSPLS